MARSATALALLIAPLLVLAPAPAAAQDTTATATLTGVVQRDSAGQPAAGAQVVLPALGREATTDARGEFRLDRLPAGAFTVVVRSVGLTPVEDTVTLVAGQTTRRAFTLGRRVAQLDSVQVTAPAVERPLSPALRAFEERRQHGGGGRFITAEELRKDDGKRFSSIITARVPGVRAVPSGGATHIASARSSSGSTGLAFQRAGGQMGRCFVNVYLDGVLLYDGGAPGARPPDFDRLDPRQFAGVEYYSGGANVPPQFNRTSNGCGVLLLWSRER